LDVACCGVAQIIAMATDEQLRTVFEEDFTKEERAKVIVAKFARIFINSSLFS
jgi:hypothetical protein